MVRKRFFDWCPQPTPPNSRVLRFSKPIAVVLAVTASIVMVSILLTSLFMNQTAAIALTMPEATPSPSETPITSPETTPTPSANPSATVQASEQAPSPTVGPGPVTIKVLTEKTIYTLAEPVKMDIYLVNPNSWPVYRQTTQSAYIFNESGSLVWQFEFNWSDPDTGYDPSIHASYPANSTTKVWGVGWNQHHFVNTEQVLCGVGNYTLVASLEGIMEFGTVNQTFTVVPSPSTIYQDNRVLPHYSVMQTYNTTSGITDWTSKIHPDDLSRYLDDALYNQSDVWMYVTDVKEHNITKYMSPETNNVTAIYIPTENVWQHMVTKRSTIPHLQFSPSLIGPVYRVVVDKANLRQIAEMPEVYCIRIGPPHENVAPTTWPYEITYYYP
jgi:hypothetical protein